MINRTGIREKGVVEGFYGRVWNQQEREAFISFLRPYGLNTYLYAPKHEAALGTDLLGPLGRESAEDLKRLAGFCAEQKISLVPGLHLAPPLEPENPAHLARLKDKVKALADLGITRMAALFDDIPVRAGSGTGHKLAGGQARAFEAAWQALDQALPQQHQTESRWWVCTSRYSLDPVIESEYGALEADYLPELNRLLPPEAAWLWTGPLVCSVEIAPEHLLTYQGEAGQTPGQAKGQRPIVLWDNYPVNDAHMAGRLHLGPLSGRSPDLASHLSGYVFNPLLQPALGGIPGATCLDWANDPGGYEPQAAWERALAVLKKQASPEAVEAYRWLAMLADGGPMQKALPANLWPGSQEGALNADVKGNERDKVALMRRHLPPAMAGEAEPWLKGLELGNQHPIQETK